MWMSSAMRNGRQRSHVYQSSYHWVSDGVSVPALSSGGSSSSTPAHHEHSRYPPQLPYRVGVGYCMLMAPTSLGGRRHYGVGCEHHLTEWVMIQPHRSVPRHVHAPPGMYCVEATPSNSSQLLPRPAWCSGGCIHRTTPRQRRGSARLLSGCGGHAIPGTGCMSL